MPPFPALPLLIAYAETHYRFRYGFTLLSRRVPEIVFDAAFRLEPGRNITAVLIIKDADRFPIELINITAAILLRGKHRIFLPETAPAQRRIDTPFFCQVLRFPVPDDCEGGLRLNFKLDYLRKGRKEFALNDNLPQGTHAPLEVAVSGHSLPRADGWHYGETHCHSHFTSDQVEYGAPLSVIPEISKAMGLSYAFVTDHSYDLASESPFQPDKNAFESLRAQCASVPQPGFCLVPGEEVSVRNSRGRTVHLAVVNYPEYLPGSGDAGRSLFRNRCELSVSEVLERIQTYPNAFAFAAHPGVREGLLEHCFLNRGRWTEADLTNALSGTQFWDGRTGPEFLRGRRQWINRLLKGHRLVFLGGNDAHGDFNRTRKIGFPFLYTAEAALPRFGQVRTALRADALTPEALTGALRQGRAVVTTGPFITLQAEKEGRLFETGGTLPPGRMRIALNALSTPEFGPLGPVILYHGISGKEERKVLLPQPVITTPSQTQYAWEFEATEPGYLRAEVSSKTANDIFYGFTNALWIGA